MYYTHVAVTCYVFCPGPCVGDRPNVKQLLEVMRIKDVDITT